MVDQLPAEESQYDVISGVSVGAINAAGLSLFPKGEEIKMAKYMSGLWANLTNSDIWRMWPQAGWDPTYGVRDAPGYLDNSPLINMMENLIKTFGLHKKVIASATDIQNGQYVSNKLHEMDQSNHKLIASAVAGSAAMPFIFPPMNMSEFGMDQMLMDGGTTWNNNMVSGVDECMKIPGIENHSQIEIDVIILHPAKIEKMNITDAKVALDAPKLDLEPKTIEFLSRKHEIRGCYSGMNDIIEFMQAYPDLSYRYFIKPDKTLLPEYKILEFDYAHTHPVYLQGIEDAKAVLDMGPGKSFENLIQEKFWKPTTA